MLANWEDAPIPDPSEGFEGDPTITVSSITAGVGMPAYDELTPGSGGTVIATQTIESVNTTTNEITITGHGFFTGCRVKFIQGTGAIGGIINQEIAYVRVIDANTIKLGPFDWTAMYNLPIWLADFTSYSGSGHQLQDVNDYVHYNVPLTGGSGTGATATIVRFGEIVDRVVIEDPGEDYEIGDVLSADSGDIGGITGFEFTVKSLGISMSRSSGQTPAVVMVAATSFNAPGAHDPFEDLHYEIDFGDPDGTETFVNPVTGGTENANIQTGPMAAYVYRTAGLKEITTTAKSNSGELVFQTTSYFDVSDHATAATYYFDSTYDGSNGASNGTEERPYTSMSPVSGSPFLASVSNRKFLLKYGSDFSGTAFVGNNEVADGIRFAAYGDPNDGKPIVRTRDGNPAIGCSGQRSAIPKAKRDWVWENIHAISDVTGGQITPIRTSSDIRVRRLIYDMYFLHCDGTVIENGNDIYQMADVSPAFRGGFWGGDMVAPTDGVGGSQGFSGGPRDHGWYFLYGNTVQGRGRSDTHDHPCYLDVSRLCMAKYYKNLINVDRNLGIKFRIFGKPDEGDVNHGKWHLISDCDFDGMIRGYAMGNGNNGRGEGGEPEESTTDKSQDWGQAKSMVVQRCRFMNMPGSIDLASTRSITIRHNFVSAVGYLLSPFGDLYDMLRTKLYGNKFYNTGAQKAIVNYENPDSPWELDHTIVFNEYYSTSANIWGYVVPMTQFQDNLSTVDHNTFWIPNETDNKIFANSSVETPLNHTGVKAFGFEQHGTVHTDPGDAPDWPNPAIGDFGQIV